MESNCPSDPCAQKSSRKKHTKSAGKHKSNNHDCSWKMSFPQNGITAEECDGNIGSQMEEFCDSPYAKQSCEDMCAGYEVNSPDTDVSIEIGLMSECDSFQQEQSASSPPGCSSDGSGGTSAKLKVNIEKFMKQKKSIIAQIKCQDPELFQEFCNCRNKPDKPHKPEVPWYCQSAGGNSPKKSSRDCPPVSCLSQQASARQPCARAPTVPSAVCPQPIHSPPRQTPSHRIYGTTRSTPPNDPCPPPHEYVCPPPVKVHSPKPRCPPASEPKPKRKPCPTQQQQCSPAPTQLPSPLPKQKCPPTKMPSYHEAPANPKQIPSNSGCSMRHSKKPKKPPPKVCPPTITGDQKKDTEAKQVFEKIKKIELDTVLDRNVHDLSLDTPDRDPALIAELLNSKIRSIDDEVTETYAALVHPIGRNKLSATDVHHTDPGSMVPKTIPVGNLNQMSAEVLDELEAIIKSQLIPYPQDDLATNETRSFDVTTKEKMKVIAPPPPPALFKCTLELQPLRVENFFQLRGSNSPAWYPGMMATFPDGRSTLRLISNPSGLINTAYTFCKP